MSYFLLSKLLLAFVALGSLGRGYDTSTSLALPEAGTIARWVRWDAIYFTQIARRGYLFEQEWAFGWGFTRLLSLLGSRKGISAFLTLYF